jgi:hypothetical protein
MKIMLRAAIAALSIASIGPMPTTAKAQWRTATSPSFLA